MTRKQTALRVVASKTSGPDLEAMERVLSESTRDMAPMVSRTSAARARMVAELQVLEADLDALEARERLYLSQTEAVKVAIERDKADIRSALQHYRNGLADGAEEQ